MKMNTPPPLPLHPASSLPPSHVFLSNTHRISNDYLRTIVTFLLCLVIRKCRAPAGSTNGGHWWRQWRWGFQPRGGGPAGDGFTKTARLPACRPLLHGQSKAGCAKPCGPAGMKLICSDVRSHATATSNKRSHPTKGTREQCSPTSRRFWNPAFYSWLKWRAFRERSRTSLPTWMVP